MGNQIIAEYLYVPFLPLSGELIVFAGALIGAGIGFLWYNTYPAQIFMGDVGSLTLGAILAVFAIFTKARNCIRFYGRYFYFGNSKCNFAGCIL